MSRRSFLGALAALGLAAPVAAQAAGERASAPAPRQKKTYLLVHGTWHGGWVWKHVRERLQAAGQTVFTPTLTGTGERVHLATRETGLSVHITDIVNVIECEELDDVILLGHAASGLTISGVADRLPGRIKHLVYFDAKVPRPGDMSFVNLRNERAAAFFQSRASKWEGGYLMDFFADYPTKMLVPESDTANTAWLKRRLTKQPAGSWTEELIYTGKGIAGIPKTFLIPGLQEYQPTPESFYGDLKNDPEWKIVTLPVHRNAQMTHPKEFADFLLSIS